jgi:small neutral amino acid transporter SnatA (MarC family)
MLVHMIEILKFALLAITSLIAVMEPASTIAVYVTLTKDMDLKKTA